MNKILRILLFLIVLCCIAQPARAAEDSLIDRTTARALSLDEAVMFGPQAGKYRYDNRMIRAAQIAQARAHRRSGNLCWRYVKTALLSAGAVDSYPKSTFAKQAAQELPRSYGFRKIRCRDPFRAPIGSVLVYGGADAGHVEIRTANGYASDFTSPTPYLKRPLIGIFVKPNT
ncbi:MAG: hypothetical protein WCF18_11690 [Chthoniobacteraceae bacterium]